MLRSVTLLTTTMVLSATLAGCGLAETGAATATGASAEVEQARKAKEIEAQVQKQVDAAVQQDADRRQAAEAESH
jgi:hypothetical protein